MLDRFRYPTMTRRNDRQPRGHRLQDRVRHTFLILVCGHLAGMQKQVRTRIKLKEFPLRQESYKMHISENAQSFSEHLQLRLKRSLASDKKFRLGIVFLKNGKRPQAGGNALFRDQTARL